MMSRAWLRRRWADLVVLVGLVACVLLIAVQGQEYLT